MKDVRQTLLERRSIRRYEREQIPQETMDFIYEAIRNTPTSYNGQQFSVIDITDQKLKEQLYELTDSKQLKTCNHLLVFLADYNKICLLAESKGLQWPDITGCVDGVMLGVIDATLAMMSAVTAAEACGLGTNCVGYLRTAAPARIAELLKLPKGVFLVCGLALGIPREMPDLKPKEPVSVMFHKDTYNQDSKQLLADLEAYDEVVKEYNANRAGGTSTNDWVAHILNYYDHATHYQLLRYLRDQGFDPTH